MLSIIDRLEQNHSLTTEEYRHLIVESTDETDEILRARADKARKKVYGNRIFIRGLIEITNICRNDCNYCGIRRGNSLCERYRLSEDQILGCTDEGYQLGFRTFVLQGGEDGFFTDQRLSGIVRGIKERHPDCAVTLSVGERSRESYEILRQAGADRYLLRHETADKEHYGRLHPGDMSFENRMRCLEDLKDLGYQVGCGFMVGSPYQTADTLAKDLKFIEEFSPHMCGIGPFIPHKDTEYAGEAAGSLKLTCRLLSIIRLMKPNILLPSTTALGTIDPRGREAGILAGGNVVMPNLSPADARSKYELYNNKLSTGAESAQSLESLKNRMKEIGYEIVTERGDMYNG